VGRLTFVSLCGRHIYLSLLFTSTELILGGENKQFISKINKAQFKLGKLIRLKHPFSLNILKIYDFTS